MSVSLSRTPDYGATAKSLHWLIVALLTAQFILAWTMPHIGRNTVPETLINLHFSIGVLMLILVVLRLAWRLTHPAPPVLGTLPRWQRWAAQAVHWLLYLLLLIIPVLGWASASGRGFELSLFGLVPLPPIILAAKSPQTGPLGDLHNYLSTYALLGLVGLHVAGALYHHFALRDSTLRRMLPRFG
jgi:cytochrome b561